MNRCTAKRSLTELNEVTASKEKKDGSYRHGSRSQLPRRIEHRVTASTPQQDQILTVFLNQNMRLHCTIATRKPSFSLTKQLKQLSYTTPLFPHEAHYSHTNHLLPINASCAGQSSKVESSKLPRPTFTNFPTSSSLAPVHAEKYNCRNRNSHNSM